MLVHKAPAALKKAHSLRGKCSGSTKPEQATLPEVYLRLMSTPEPVQTHPLLLLASIQKSNSSWAQHTFKDTPTSLRTLSSLAGRRRRSDSQVGVLNYGCFSLSKQCIERCCPLQVWCTILAALHHSEQARSSLQSLLPTSTT
jgi:hypothetical protein